MNRIVRQGTMAAAVVGALGVVGAGCLTRPIAQRDPVTKTNFGNVLQNQSVDKLDLLFMIDNSASMGDKQALLALAVPDMINRLVKPNCLDANSAPTLATADPEGHCPAGQKAEFPPVHDMHIGILSSSLGGRGGTQCPADGVNPANQNLPAHNDDRGELLNRGGVPSDPTVETVVADATSPLNFLSWFPDVTANKGKSPPPTTPITSSDTLIADFAQMVAGVHEHGCGFEAQNEAWYRFLVQPDPYDSITVQNYKASYNGVDATILKQRAAFLRPDSLVAVIVVTDENQETANPLALNQQGWAYETGTGMFPVPGGIVPEGTVECGKLDVNNPLATGANDANCTSCYGLDLGNPTNAARCPADGAGSTPGYLTAADDYINVRFFEQKRRFGAYAGYPPARYVRGLTSRTVPDSQIGHEVDAAGSYIGDKDENANCVNPLFADKLPTDPSADLCHLDHGTRTPDLVYYAAISGVPHQLLQQDPSKPDSPQKETLSSDDWTRILGQDTPLSSYSASVGQNYDLRGIDYHMVESEEPRTTNTGGWANASTCPPGSPIGCDPINGAEWSTNKTDLQFACTFDLRPQYGGRGKDCTDKKYSEACDCASGGLDANAPLCTGTTQIYGKAYPAVQELTVAREMSKQNAMNGGQGIVSSLCPIHVTPTNNDNPPDPLFGYRPAVNAIVNRLKTALDVQCVPQTLKANNCGDYPCLVLVSLTASADPNNPSLCKNPGAACSIPGLSAPDPNDAQQMDVWGKFCDSAEDDWKKSGGFAEPYTVPLCQMAQLYQSTGGPGCGAGAKASDFDSNGSCAASGDPGWCYVQGAAAGGCGHSILFTNNEPPHGATVSLQCIEQSVTVLDGGGD
jgi:hypothetical protein